MQRQQVVSMCGTVAHSKSFGRQVSKVVVGSDSPST